MSEPRGGYTDTYVESVEWQRDKAYARAEKAERELEMVGKKHQLALEAAWGERNAAEARAEKAEAEVERLRLERGTTVAITVALREELDKRDEGVRFWQSGCDTANEARAAAEARAEKLAAALRFYADPQSYGISGGSCQRVISDAGRIAARALAELGEK